MDPLSVAEILAERSKAQAKGDRDSDICSLDTYRVVERLKRKFGLGDRPKVRLALYKWLAGKADLHGERVLEVISTAVAQSISASKPGRYFSSCVVKMLREKGLACPQPKEGGDLW